MRNKTTKHRMIKTLYWIFSLPLLLICASTILTYDYFCLISYENNMVQAQYTGIFLTICLLLAVVVIVLPWSLRKQGIKQRLLAFKWPITIIMAGFVLFLQIDTTSLKDDYNEQDIIPDSPQTRQSYKILSSMIGERKIKIDVDRVKLSSYDFLANIQDHETEVKAAWNLIIEERKIIKALSSFNSVVGINPKEKLTFDMPLIQFSAILNIQSIYLAYTALNIQKGQPEKGLSELDCLYQVAKKGAVSTPLLIHKMVWIGGVINKTIEGIYLIQSLDYTDSKTRKLLLTQFTPLTNREVSLEKVFIGEYLFNKNALESIEPGWFMDTFSTFNYCDNEISGFRQAFSTIIYYLSFKKNRAIAFNRIFFESLITGAKRTPPDTEKADQVYGGYRRNPTLRNLSGWAFSIQTSADFSMYVNRISKIKVKSDLLTIHLQKDSGVPVSLKNYFSDDPYEINNQNGNLSTPGPDGVFETEDDITLGALK